MAAGSGPAPWTRAERTREIGYALAMYEMYQVARELKVTFGGAPRPDFDAMPPEVAWVMGASAAMRFANEIAAYARDAWLLHGDPASLSECVSRLADGGYGTPPPELSGDPR